MKRGALLLAALLALSLAGCDAEPREPWQPVPETAHPGAYPEPLTGEPYGPDALAPGCSSFVVGAFVDLPFVALTFVALALALLHRRRARAERDFDPAAPLRNGPAVISGVVELEGETPPVVVRILQDGTEETTKNGTHHTWRERSREVTAVPFLVRRDDGTRVRVEPDERVVLHGSLTRTERTALNLRNRVASIGAGDRVHVHGELVGAGRARGGAYRGAARTPVLRASRLAPLMISSEPPGDTEARLTRFHLRAAALLAGAFLFLSLIVAPAFQLLSLDGQVLDARPLETRAWQVWVKPKGATGHWEWKHALRGEVRAPSGEVIPVEDLCSQEIHDCTSRGGCRAVPFLVSRLAPSFHQIGTEAKLDGARPWLLVVLGLVLGLIYPFATAEKRPWYARRRLVDTGSGSLESTMDTES